MQAKLFTLCTALCAVCLSATSQNVPDYVPTDGLVAWYPFNGNANDESGNGNDGVANGAVLSTDRWGLTNRSYSFSGSGDYVVAPRLYQNAFSVSLWFKTESVQSYNPLIDAFDSNWEIQLKNSHADYVSFNDEGGYIEHLASDIVQNNVWYNLICTFSDETVSFYTDGTLIDQFSVFALPDNSGDYFIGASMSGIPQFFIGRIDDIGIWNRALTEEEILGLYNAQLPVPGCTDSTACNFDTEATSDDGSCIPSGCMETDACNYNALAECDGVACDYSCCPGPGCCGEGTIWNSLEQTCESIPCETILDPLACGAGTFWDETTSQCLPILTCKEDLDGDGVIGVEDLMQLLSSFGTMCEDSEPETGEFTCSDPMNYHGYDYATVQIGEQCWFAENLRTEYYANGDPIPSDIQDSLLWATAGAQTYFSEDSVFLEERGRMYNGHAVLDARGLCPTGWHVPSDSDFIQLEGATGMSEVDWESTAEDRGCSLEIGGAWKSQTGWYPGDQGTDLWGLSVQPSGYFLTGEGFGNAYTNSEFWTSTPYDATRLWRRQVPANSGCLFRGWWEMSLGSAIRCVEDTEE